MNIWRHTVKNYANVEAIKIKIKVEVITAPGCSKCAKARETIQKVLQKQKNVEYKEISLFDNPDVATKYGIMSTPSVIINGELAFEGNPGEEKLRKKLEEYY